MELNYITSFAFHIISQKMMNMLIPYNSYTTQFSDLRLTNIAYAVIITIPGLAEESMERMSFNNQTLVTH